MIPALEIKIVKYKLDTDECFDFQVNKNCECYCSIQMDQMIVITEELKNIRVMILLSFDPHKSMDPDGVENRLKKFIKF